MMDEDLDVFLDVGEFADVMTKPGGTTVNVVFDEAFFDPSTGETVLDTTQPRATAKLSDLAGLSRGSKVTIRSKSYTVVNVQPDGTGMAILKLSNQA